MTETLEPSLQEVVDLLRVAFPEGVPSEDLDPLLVVLWEGLSERNLGVVVEEFAGLDRYQAIHQAVTALNKRPMDRAHVAKVKALLVRHGWDPDDDL